MIFCMRERDMSISDVILVGCRMPDERADLGSELARAVLETVQGMDNGWMREVQA